MTKPVLLALAAYFALLGLTLVVAPGWFYAHLPGVSDSGPFNSHFARDVGFAFVVSAVALAWSVARGDRVLALFGAGFPMLHGLYHLAEVRHHGLASTVAELAGTLGPGLIAAYLATRLKGGVA